MCISKFYTSSKDTLMGNPAHAIWRKKDLCTGEEGKERTKEAIWVLLCVLSRGEIAVCHEEWNHSTDEGKSAWSYIVARSGGFCIQFDGGILDPGKTDRTRCNLGNAIRHAPTYPPLSMQHEGNGCRLLCWIYIYLFIYEVACELYDWFGSSRLPSIPLGS